RPRRSAPDRRGRGRPAARRPTSRSRRRGRRARRRRAHPERWPDAREDSTAGSWRWRVNLQLPEITWVCARHPRRCDRDSPSLSPSPPRSLLHRIWTAVRGGEDPEALREEIRRLEVAHASDVEALSQRDRLLRMMVESSPTAMVLVGETGVIVFTNEAARELFFEGRDARGGNFLKMLAGAAEPLRRALASDTDEIFTFDHEGGPETYHVGKRHFTFEDEPHTLITVRHMTHEVSRQEILVLKRTLRIIGHELANSMAPASSLLRSARQMLARPELHGSLEKALQTVEERLAHLQGFLAGLARLGQLPRPKKRDVAWPEFLDGLRALFPDAVIAPPPGGTGWFDPAQIQQVLINLVKNAHEAGGPRDTVVIEVE